MRRPMLVLLCLLLLLPVLATAESLFLQPGPEGQDAEVDSADAWANHGDEPWVMRTWDGWTLWVAALIEFDLGQIPSGSSIESAVLTLYHVQNTQDSTAWQVLALLDNWTEEKVTLDSMPRPGFDVYDTASLDGDGGTYISWDITALVAEWVAGTLPNYGLIIQNDGGITCEYPELASGDHPTAAYRPSLNIAYTPGTAVNEASWGAIKTGLLP